MTLAEKLLANSTLSSGTMIELIDNPLGTGGGGIVINSNVIDLVEEPATKIEELSDILTVTEQIESVAIVSTAEAVQIIEEEL